MASGGIDAHDSYMGNAGEKLQQMLGQIDLSIEGLAAELTHRTGHKITKSSIQYYCNSGTTKFKGPTLPANKPWAKALQGLLIERGIPPVQVLALFGITSGPDDLRPLVESLLTKINGIEARLDDLQTEPPRDRRTN